jgi:dephospho-CoA kinase
MNEKKRYAVANQFIPEPFLDKVSALSEFQTLLGEAIVKHDHRIFAAALKKYLYCNEKVISKLFDIFKDIIDDEMHKASAFF